MSLSSTTSTLTAADSFGAACSVNRGEGESNAIFNGEGCRMSSSGFEGGDGVLRGLGVDLSSSVRSSCDISVFVTVRGPSVSFRTGRGSKKSIGRVKVAVVPLPSSLDMMISPGRRV